MNNVRLVVALIAAGLSAGCFEKQSSSTGTASTVLYRHHFLGIAELAHNTNAAKIPAILGLPQSRDLGQVILQKASNNPEQLWRKFLPAGVTTPPDLARPLVEDLGSQESYAEVRGPLQRGESVFAIELNEERAKLWSSNLASILAGWKLGKPAPLNLGDAQGWEIKRSESPNLIQFVRAGKWVLVGVGPEKLTLLPNLLADAKKKGRPIESQPTVPLELDADIPRLRDWLPGLTHYGIPPFQLKMIGKGETLRTEARLLFSEPLPYTGEAWKIPTNLIHDPIVGFTVARGTAALLRQVRSISMLGLKPLPNQFCAWVPATIHANLSVSVPMANPSNVLYQIGPNLPDFTSNLLSQSIGGFSLISNRNELVWGGWPVFLPTLHAIEDGGTDYLLLGLLPTRPMTNPAPPELFEQLKDKPNLVYYDWEFTKDQVVHSKQMQQIWDMLNQAKFPSTNAPTEKWAYAIAPLLGNTITEATLSSPKELTITRKSDCGLTGFELATLARWIESRGFPWRFDPPPPTSAHPKPPGSRTNAPSGTRIPPTGKKP